MCNKYNGWTNYETWCFALWNDSYSLADLFEDEFSAEELEDRYTLWKIAERLKDDAYENNPWGDENHGFYSDVLQASISAVNWSEIAEHVIEALQERLPEPDEEEEPEEEFPDVSIPLARFLRPIITDDEEEESESI